MSNQNINEVLSILYPVLYAFLIGFLGYIGKQIVKVVPKIINLIVAKIGLTNYQKTKNIAWDIFNLIEEHFRINELISDKVQAKILMFETMIKQKVPGITDSDIELFRQAIAGEFNKYKPAIVQAIEQPIEEVKIEPIVRYVAPDGTELQPITSQIVTQ